MKELSKKTMDKLKEHAKLHKGGMNSKHMKDMVRFMKAGDSFDTAHKKAMKGSPKKKKPPQKIMGNTTRSKSGLTGNVIRVNGGY